MSTFYDAATFVIIRCWRTAYNMAGDPRSRQTMELAEGYTLGSLRDGCKLSVRPETCLNDALDIVRMIRGNILEIRLEHYDARMVRNSYDMATLLNGWCSAAWKWDDPSLQLSINEALEERATR